MPPLQAALVRLTDTLMAGNRRGYAALADSSDLRDHAKRIKEHTLAHLDRYLEQLEASIVASSAATSTGRRRRGRPAHHRRHRRDRRTASGPSNRSR